MPHETFSIANYFVCKAYIEGEILCVVKLQKLVYFAHCWNLAINEKPLVHEPVAALQYGPAFMSLFDFPCGLDKLVRELGSNENGEFLMSPLSPGEKSVVDDVWNEYKKFDATQLCSISHTPGSPWDQTDKSKGFDKFIKINNDLIKKYYIQKSEEADDEEDS